MGLIWLGKERVQGDPRGPAGPPWGPPYRPHNGWRHCHPPIAIYFKRDWICRRSGANRLGLLESALRKKQSITVMFYRKAKYTIS